MPSGHREPTPPVVRTTSGPVRGKNLGQTKSFLGIPYAQSIAGPNRFAPPQPVGPWTEAREAVRYADSAPQQEGGVIGVTPVTPAFAPPAYVKSGDDCLALNVWTPSAAHGDLPVMVWLHGGGWVSGSGSCAIYDGENLASRGDVVVVTINHRLGAHGLTDFSRVLGRAFADSANLGIKDIVAALKWVRDNIAGFGGNPDLVTIFGESGGGWKVNTLLGVPSAKGLFHRAIVESGPLTRFATPDQADDVARAMLAALGISKDNPEAANNLTFQQVLEAEAAVMASAPMSFQAPGFPTGFWPVIDGDFIPRHVFDPDTAAGSRDVPLLIGQTGTEFTLFMLKDETAFSLDEAGLDQRVAQFFGQDNAPKILGTYRRALPDYDASGLWFRIVSDYGMGALSTEIMTLRADVGMAPVYAFRFDWMTPIENGKLYSPHTIEIPFVFDNVSTEPGKVMTGGGEPAAALAAAVSEAWVQFAKTGVPSAANLPDWPAYSTDTRAAMHLDTQSRVAPYMDPAMAALFRDILWTRAGIG